MGLRRATWTGLLAAGLLALLWAASRRGEPPPGAPDRTGAPARAAPETSPPQPPPAAPPPFRREGGAADGPLDPLRKALRAGDPEALAARAAGLRAAARADARVRAELLRALSDRAEPFPLREAAAFILGSLPDPEVQRSLAAALLAPDEPGMLRALLYALASVKPEDDDDLFGFPDTPWVAQGECGLRIKASAPLALEDARRAAGRLLAAHPDAGLRWDAARALRHSLSHDDARRTFSDALAAEGDPETLSEIGSALGEWCARGGAASAERDPLLDRILSRCMEEGQSPLRILLLPSLREVPLAAGPLAALKWEAVGSAPAEMRDWAMQALADRAGTLPPGERLATAALLLSVLRGEPDAKLRDQAARHLRRFPEDERVAPALLEALRTAPEWHVRASAAEALGAFREDARVLSALRIAAASDPDGTVRETAGRSLERLGGR